MKEIILDFKSAKKLLPERPENSNKGTFGKVLIICGSRNMCGCCILAAQGALRSGVGLVTLAFPEDIYIPVLLNIKEAVFMPLKTNADGCICENETGKILSCAEKNDVVVYGCGVGVNQSTKLLTETLISECGKPLILDADALNCLSQNTSVLKNKKCDILITPHPGEMSRLINKSVDYVESNRIDVITGFCNEYNISALLKGYETLIYKAGSDFIYKNKTGNSGLSKGGSGDLLSGIIGGLCATLKGDLQSAASLGAFIHGLCADILRNEFTEYSMLPSDCAGVLPFAIKKILSEGE